MISFPNDRRSAGLRRRGGVAALLAATAAVAVAAPSAGAAPAPSATASAGQHLTGWATLGPRAPLVGGTVAVETLQGRSLVAHGGTRTGRDGAFDVAVRSLPRQFIVEVRGGRAAGRALGGTLALIATRTGPKRGLCLTPVSRLVAERMARHGSRSRAEREVRAKLRLGSGYDLRCGLRTTAGPFDGVAYRDAAHRAGGFDAFTEQFAGDVARPRAFRGR